MKPRIEKLDRDAMLMLYASGEMTLEQKQRVDAMLSGDEAMQKELSQLMAAHAMFERELAEIDRTDAMPISDAAANRAVSRVIRQRQADQLASPMRVGALPKRRWMVLMYPAGIAAAVLGVGIYQWSKVQDPTGPTLAGTGTGTELADAGDTAEAEEQYASAVFPNLDDSSDQLDHVEAQITTLAAWSQPLQ